MILKKKKMKMSHTIFIQTHFLFSYHLQICLLLADPFRLRYGGKILLVMKVLKVRK